MPPLLRIEAAALVGLAFFASSARAEITGAQLEELYLIQLGVKSCDNLPFPADKRTKLDQVVSVMERGSSFSDADLILMRGKARTALENNPAKICHDVGESIPTVVRDLK